MDTISAEDSLIHATAGRLLMRCFSAVTVSITANLVSHIPVVMLLNKKIPLRYLFSKVKYEMLYILVIGLITHYLKNHFRNQIPDMPISIPAFIGTAISVLLSFKLNQSYDRWWEARKVWGGIVNDSRTFVIQMQSFIRAGNETRIQTIAHRHIAWLYSLGQGLRGLNPVDNLAPYLTEADMNVLQSHNNKPLALLQQNSLDLSGLHENDQLPLFSLIQINATLVNFSNQMGMCERIKSTVFPATYRQYLRWIIYLFTIVLSIALGKIDIIFELPLLLAISTGFFLLEKTADSLQDPFNNQPTDTAMTAIARNIEINIRQLLGESTIPQPVEATDFYLS